MRGFKEKSFSERQTSSADAKRALLRRFHAQPGPDDPAVIEQRAARQALVAAREKRIAERGAARREAKARAAPEAHPRAEREPSAPPARAAREAAEALALEAERKAARDARYAARKSRQK